MSTVERQCFRQAAFFALELRSSIQYVRPDSTALSHVWRDLHGGSLLSSQAEAYESPQQLHRDGLHWELCAIWPKNLSRRPVTRLRLESGGHHDTAFTSAFVI